MTFKHTFRLAPIAVAVLGALALPAHADEPTSLPTVVVVSDDLPVDSYTSPTASVGGKTPQALKEIPNSVSVLTRARMDDQNMTSVEDALRYSTGITAVKYGDGTAYYKSRGYDVGIEFDGLPIASGIQYQPQFDLAMYDQVEVFRGPAGLIDGAGEPGGTVNMVRKRPSSTTELQSETQIGSFGSIRQMIDTTGALNADNSVRGRAVVVGAYEKQSIDDTTNKEVMVYGALDIDLLPGTTLALSAAIQNNPLSAYDYGASVHPDGSFVKSSWSQNFSPDWNYTNTSMQELNANLKHEMQGGWKAEATVFYRHLFNHSNYAYSGGGVDPVDNTSDYSGQSQRSTYNWWGADAHVAGPVQLWGQQHEVQLGANYSLLSDSQRSGYQDLGMFDIFDASSIPKADTPLDGYGINQRIEQYGVYGQARIHVTAPFTVVLGGRETFYRQQSQPVIPTPGDWATDSQLNGKFIPYAGLVYDLTKEVTAYASYSKIFAPQTATTFSGSGLAPRTGEQYEAGFKAAFLNNRLNASIAAFRINDSNRAVSDPDHATGSINAGKAQSQGWEADINGSPLQNWNLYAGYTLLNTRYADDPALQGQKLDGEEPQHQLKLWTTYQLSQGAFSGVKLGGGMLAQSSTNRGAQAQGGYAVFDAQVSYRINANWDASLMINNLFNREYYVRVPSSYFGEFGDTRNAMLTLRAAY